MPDKFAQIEKLIRNARIEYEAVIKELELLKKRASNYRAKNRTLKNLEELLDEQKRFNCELRKDKKKLVAIINDDTNPAFVRKKLQIAEKRLEERDDEIRSMMRRGVNKQLEFYVMKEKMKHLQLFGSK